MCLLDDPADEVEEWCYRAHEFSKDNKDARDTLLAQLVGGGDVHPQTRRRAQALREALVTHRDRLLGLAAAAGIA
ncbi:MAG: hypothetical protein AAF721_15335, partial [Myxococcota bacterium]